MPVPTAATRGVKLSTYRSSSTGTESCPYDFLQHIPASQHMACNRTASLVRTNMEVDADPQPPVADDVGLKVRKRMGRWSREELPVPSSTSVPWLRIRIPIHLPQMPADTVLTKGRPRESTMLTHMPAWQARHQALDDVPVIQVPFINNT
ncbi:hypothetical protein EI94DRAFT_1708085 [Lactarius quietus]|nr:hypothetical protein EI94DRAFT_1708085 [Lactarius quietus]